VDVTDILLLGAAGFLLYLLTENASSSGSNPTAVTTQYPAQPTTIITTPVVAAPVAAPPTTTNALITASGTHPCSDLLLSPLSCINGALTENTDQYGCGYQTCTIGRSNFGPVLGVVPPASAAAGGTQLYGPATCSSGACIDTTPCVNGVC
jgi:hypothetical protein